MLETRETTKPIIVKPFNKSHNRLIKTEHHSLALRNTYIVIFSGCSLVWGSALIGRITVPDLAVLLPLGTSGDQLKG